MRCGKIENQLWLICVYLRFGLQVNHMFEVEDLRDESVSGFDPDPMSYGYLNHWWEKGLFLVEILNCFFSFVKGTRKTWWVGAQEHSRFNKINKILVSVARGVRSNLFMAWRSRRLEDDARRWNKNHDDWSLCQSYVHHAVLSVCRRYSKRLSHPFQLFNDIRFE